MILFVANYLFLSSALWLCSVHIYSAYMYNCTFTQMLLPCPLYLMQGFPRTRSQSLGRSTPLQVAAGCAPDSRLCFSSYGISHCICQCLCICICLCSRLRSSLCFSSSGRSLVRFPDWLEGRGTWLGSRRSRSSGCLSLSLSPPAQAAWKRARHMFRKKVFFQLRWRTNTKVGSTREIESEATWAAKHCGCKCNKTWLVWCDPGRSPPYRCYYRLKKRKRRCRPMVRKTRET